MTPRDVVLAALVVLTVATAVSAQRAAHGVGDATPEAVAWHGAWHLYRNVAVFAGKRALYAEAAYWRAVST